MNRQHFLQTLATIAGATLSPSNALSIVSITDPDKYQKTVQLLSDFYLQTDNEGIYKSCDIVLNHLLTAFDEPLENERVFNVITQYWRGANLSGFDPAVDAVAPQDMLDADIKNSVFPVLTMMALIRTKLWHMEEVPSCIALLHRYRNIVFAASPN